MSVLRHVRSADRHHVPDIAPSYADIGIRGIGVDIKRELSTRFGSESYAAEELVAELTSAFLCAELGVQG